MKHSFEAHVVRSQRTDIRQRDTPMVMRFSWKMDGALIESGEYTLTELERLIADLPATDPSYRPFTRALRKLRAVS